jgi:NAD(P)-dependent dehydrogenase (short-subunit alcohol dehydrogenase family)
MPGELAGRTAIVTGASRGIGLAIAQALAGSGANVVMTSRQREAADAAAAALGPGRAVGYGAHAADEQAAAGCVAFAIEHFGNLDILVNNAGTNPAFGPVVEQDHARFTKTMDVNL